jgi:hypothetical protein
MEFFILLFITCLLFFPFFAQLVIEGNIKFNENDNNYTGISKNSGTPVVLIGFW